MAASPPPLYGFDIETDTSLDGLDPALAPVVAAAVSTPDGDQVLLGDEAELLERLDALLASLPPGLLVTWNGRCFDLPFVACRAATLGVPLQLELWSDDVASGPGPWPPPAGGYRGRWGAHGHLDGYGAFRADVRRVLGLSCGLKAMARLVGLTPVEVDYEQLHLMGHDELGAYVASDARLAAQLVARRLPGVLASVDRTGPHAPVVTLSPAHLG
jgi:hypothetical protein